MTQQTQNKRLIELGVAQYGINARDMGLAIAALAQENARARMVAAATATTIAALTDSSGGTSNSVMVSQVPTGVAAVNPASAPTKATFDTKMGLVEDAHQELVEIINLMITAVAGPTARMLDTTAGAAGDGTIAVIGSFTNATDDTVDLATGNAQIITARNNQASIASALNYVRVAMGLAPITDMSGGVFSVGDTYEQVDAAATDAAASEVDDPTMTAASAAISLEALKGNIAAFAEGINDMIGTLDMGPFVVATNNPSFRFRSAHLG